MDDLVDIIMLIQIYDKKKEKGEVKPCPFVKWVEKRNRIIQSIIQYVQSNDKK